MTPYQRHVASIDSIPPELRDLPIWCAWRLVHVPGKPKPDKRPISPLTNRGDGWNQAGFCTNAQRAIDYAESRPDLHGIGLVLYDEFGIAGGDLDHCRNPETAEPSDRAAEILATASTYTEVSPSLGGYRFLAFGSFGGHTGNDNNIGVEFYEAGRFLTFTGNHVEDSPFAIEQRDLSELGKQYFSKVTTPSNTTTTGGNFSQVDINALNLKPWTIEAITTGGGKGKRSDAIWGVMRDMANAGCDDLTICRVLADPRYRIADKALENRQGDIHSAMRWVASQLPKARESVNLPPDSGKPFSLDAFSIVGDIDQLEEKMQNDVFVMGRLALLGQATVIFARANAGKTLLTLKLLIDSIIENRIDPKKLYYINADDTFSGLVTKAKIARKYGFAMLAPNHNKFNPSEFEVYIKRLIEQDTASGVIVVLDTLKKFSDLMEKRKSTEFNKTIRHFVLAGGTAIMLAHVNKHTGADGKVIHAGTTDSVDDTDAAYTVEVLPSRSHDKRVIVFENLKSRGDNALRESYQYAEKGTVSDYTELLASVESVDNDAVEQSRQMEKSTKNLRQNESAIKALIQAMQAGYKTQTEIVKHANANCEHGTKKLNSILKQHAGNDFLVGHCWSVQVTDKNAHLYEPLPMALKIYENN